MVDTSGSPNNDHSIYSSPHGFASSETETFPRTYRRFLTVSLWAEAKHLAETCSFLAAARALFSWKVSQLTEAKHFSDDAATGRRFRFCGKRNKNVKGLNCCSEGQLSVQDRSFVADQPGDRSIRTAALHKILGNGGIRPEGDIEPWWITQKSPVYPVYFLVKIELSIVSRDHRSHAKQQNFNFFPLPQGQGPYLSYPLYIFLRLLMDSGLMLK
jgi:hypothetical protein